MTLFGNDVSSNNGLNNIDLGHNDFSIVKMSEGTGYYNPSAYNQSKQVQDAGKLLGYYHWLTPGIDPVAQADYFLSGLGADAYADGIVLAVDVEENGLTGNEPKPFLDRIYQVTGKRPIVYMNSNWASGANGAFDWGDISGEYALWLAGGKNYGQNLPYGQFPQGVFGSVKWWQDITIWQYTSAPYDRNVLFGNADTWHKLGTKVGNSTPIVATPKQQPVPAPNYAYTPKNAPRFDVGDKVQVLPTALYETNGYDLTPHRIWQGVVTRVTPVQWSNSEYEYTVVFSDGSHNDHVLEQDLQLWATSKN